MLVTASGSIVSQAILVISTPILTRLYSPEAIGQYSAFIALVTTLAVVVTLNYEIAIPLARDTREANAILILTLAATTVVSMVVWGGLATSGQVIFGLLGIPYQSYYPHITLALLLLIGVTKVLSYWLIRERQFGLSSIAKIGQSLSQSITQVSLGAVSHSSFGLLAGQMVSQLGFLIIAGTSVLKTFTLSSIHEIIGSSRRHYRFPLITIWSCLIHAIAANMLSVALISLHGAAVAGQFALCFRVLQLPVNFVGASLAQVLYPAAVEARDSVKLDELILGTLNGLNAFAFPVFSALLLVSPELFSMAFGARWEDAGVYTRVLLPWVLLSLYSVSLSILVSVLDEQAKEFKFQLLYLFLTMLGVVLASRFGNPLITIGAISLAAFLSLGPKIWWLLSLVGVKGRTAMAGLIREAVFTLPLILFIAVVRCFLVNPLVILGCTAVAVAANILFNHRFRNSYEFK